jgi:hypothetical protein
MRDGTRTLSIMRALSTHKGEQRQSRRLAIWISVTSVPKVVFNHMRSVCRLPREEMTDERW